MQGASGDERLQFMRQAVPPTPEGLFGSNGAFQAAVRHVDPAFLERVRGAAAGPEMPVQESPTMRAAADIMPDVPPGPEIDDMESALKRQLTTAINQAMEIARPLRGVDEATVGPALSDLELSSQQLGLVREPQEPLCREITSKIERLEKACSEVETKAASGALPARVPMPAPPTAPTAPMVAGAALRPAFGLRIPGTAPAMRMSQDLTQTEASTLQGFQVANIDSNKALMLFKLQQILVDLQLIYYQLGGQP